MRSRTDLPCGRPAAATILGVRFCERCAREQKDYFAVGELTRVSRGESGAVAGRVGQTAKASRSGRPAGLRGRQIPAVGSAKTSFLPVLVAICILASAACGGDGRAGGEADAPEARAETTRERARPAEATAEGHGDGGITARSGDAEDAVARTGDAKARAGKAAREGGGEAPEQDAAGLTLRVAGEPGTGFSGVCSVGQEERAIAGRVPERYAFEPGDAGLECEIRKEGGGGAMEVIVAGEGVRSVQRTATGEGAVRFALSGGGNSSLSLSQAVTSSDKALPE